MLRNQCDVTLCELRRNFVRAARSVFRAVFDRVTKLRQPEVWLVLWDTYGTLAAFDPQ